MSENWSARNNQHRELQYNRYLQSSCAHTNVITQKQGRYYSPITFWISQLSQLLHWLQRNRIRAAVRPETCLVPLRSDLPLGKPNICDSPDDSICSGFAFPAALKLHTGVLQGQNRHTRGNACLTQPVAWRDAQVKKGINLDWGRHRFVWILDLWTKSVAMTALCQEFDLLWFLQKR